MVEISNLNVLLKSMKPKLINTEFVFCTVSEEQFSSLNVNPLFMFKEEEGTTIVIERKTADSNSLSYSNVWVLITLTAHSNLTAVGFLAAITDKLAKAGISVNVVSAYYHDHLFVPFDKAEKAMTLLKKLSKSK